MAKDVDATAAVFTDRRLGPEVADFLLAPDAAGAGRPATVEA